MQHRLLASILALGAATFGCGDDGDDGAGGEAPAPCAAGRLCLDVVEEGEAQAGRVAVVWFRFEGDLGYDPTVAYDAAFDTATTAVEIAMADVEPPPDVDMICERSCPDPAMCPCTGEFRAAVAYVMVVRDGDGDGVISPPDVTAQGAIVGVADAAIGYGEREWLPAPAPYDATFPAGVQPGVAAYELLGGKLTPAAEGERFLLKVGPNVF